MNSKLRLIIVSQEEQLLNQEVDSVSLPTESGVITVLKDHQPLISKLTFGELTYMVGSKEQALLLTQGFVHKKSDNTLLVVVDSAFSARELSNDKIRAALAKAKTAYQTTRDKKELLMMEASLKQMFWEQQLENKRKNV